jgi:hypothetical protein
MSFFANLWYINIDEDKNYKHRVSMAAKNYFNCSFRRFILICWYRKISSEAITATIPPRI